MPIYDATEAFERDVARLPPAQAKRFRVALSRFIADLEAMEAGEPPWFRPGLRVKRVRGTAGLYEMTWAPDGRATLSWGSPARRGMFQVEWERCGDHTIL